MVALSKDAILSAADSKVQAVDVPEWGGTVYIRTFNAIERDKLSAQLTGAGGKDLMHALIARFGICDEKGVPLFVDADVLKLGAKSAIALTRVVDRIVALNKMRPEDVEQAAKN